jgi:hypothetical protein
MSGGRVLDLTPASDQVIDQDDHGYDQQDMNQAATDVADESQQPQNQQDYQYCPQHLFVLL